MNQDFTGVMSQRTNEELIKIVTLQRDDYQPKAVVAAEKELESRELKPEVLEHVKQYLIQKDKNNNELDTSFVSSGLRFVHWIVDSVVFMLIAMILGFLISLVRFKAGALANQLIACVLVLASFCFYFVFMEYKYQKTLGKFITRTKVLMKDDRKPELQEIIIRTACRLIPLDRISFLFTRTGFHDKFSNTKVVKDSYINQK